MEKTLSSINITKNQLINTLNRLAENNSTSLQDLPKDLANDLSMVQGAATSLLASSKKSYSEFTSLILKIPRPSKIIPATLGAFLFGCFQETYGDVSEDCSPLCIGSLHPKGGCSKCLRSVWTYFNYDLKLISKANSKTGYLFVDLNFEGLSWNDIHTLSKHGLSNVICVRTEFSKHFFYSNYNQDINPNTYISIRKLAISKKTPLEIKKSRRRISKKKQNSSNFLFVFFFILIIISVVLVKANLFKKNIKK